MASPNLQVASANLASVHCTVTEVDTFCKTNRAASPNSTPNDAAQGLFNRLALLASDPFSDMETVELARRKAEDLYPWVIKQVKPDPRNLQQFEVHRTDYIKSLEPAPKYA